MRPVVLNGAPWLCRTGRLTEEERLKKLAEMTGNASVHEEARWQRLASARKKDDAEEASLAQHRQGTARLCPLLPVFSTPSPRVKKMREALLEATLATTITLLSHQQGQLAQRTAFSNDS